LPGRVKRTLTSEELKLLHKRSKDYVRYADQHRYSSVILGGRRPGIHHQAVCRCLMAIAPLKIEGKGGSPVSGHGG
jgi:hypothetical protein